MMVYHRDGCMSRELAWLQNTECVGSLGEKAFSDAHMACEQHGGAEGGESLQPRLFTQTSYGIVEQIHIKKTFASFSLILAPEKAKRERI